MSWDFAVFLLQNEKSVSIIFNKLQTDFERYFGAQTLYQKLSNQWNELKSEQREKFRQTIIQGIIKFGKNREVFKKLCLTLSMYTLFSSIDDEKFNIFNYFTLQNIKISFSSDPPSYQEVDCRGAILIWLQYIPEQVQTLNLASNLM